MSWSLNRRCLCLMLTGMVMMAAWRPGHCAATDPVPAIANPTAFLDQAESLERKDHPRFVQMLAQIHQAAPAMTSSDQWHLRYLDAWETMFEGNYAKSEVQLRQVVDHSGDATLAFRASSLLLMNLWLTRHYEEAFALANRLTAQLPQIKDPMTRYVALTYLSQMLDFAGQTDLAVKYAQMMEGAMPRGENRCLTLNLQVAARSNGKRLVSSDPQIQEAIDACTASHQFVAVDSVWLVLSSLYLDENQPAKAISLLDRIDPSIRASHFFFHMLSSQAERAEAYAKLGNDSAAKNAALAAIALSHPGQISEWLMVAYRVLYDIEKKEGHHAAALAYYEQYVTQDKDNLDDVSARTMAYEVAKQDVLQEKLETETLSKQNNILRLQQALDKKAVEASRLYIVLLLLALVSIIYWLLRIKRSQLRFKQLSSLDGLTGILNHQNFMSEADRTLRGLEKKQGSACLVYVDLDYFKQVNDTHGHAVGDAVLRRTVAICRQHLRPTDLFGRLGGEEFGILLLDCSSHQGAGIADRIRETIEAASVDGDGYAVSFSVSVGLASSNRCGYNLHLLCKEADAALYRAKRTGRNRVIADSESGNLLQA
ncbi:MAG TPA: GGDEF domain-containing protein [Dyella sp.]|uniref:sensor domain-containing diguanylate cyclase n=1 Tax=Dyella sp. TaxID=1869338 RepID=UPI002CC80736|nr:GGDEF domain-containing protein [Dyella sp.]HTV87132.1 GGDEF domain-containing protein [Dyella sp.]